MNTTKILIAEDQEMFRMGLVALLRKSNEWEIIGTASDGLQAVDLARKKRPELIVMDVDLPRLDGVAACKLILKDLPDVKILALSHMDEESSIFSMINAGALGYVHKEASMEELKLAIQALAKGDSYFSKSVSSILLSKLRSKWSNREVADHQLVNEITGRELQILQFIAQEMSNKEIADRLFISPRTVETHKRNMIQKLKVRNTIGLVKYYFNIAYNRRGNTA